MVPFDPRGSPLPCSEQLEAGGAQPVLTHPRERGGRDEKREWGAAKLRRRRK